MSILYFLPTASFSRPRSRFFVFFLARHGHWATRFWKYVKKIWIILYFKCHSSLSLPLLHSMNQGILTARSWPFNHQSMIKQSKMVQSLSVVFFLLMSIFNCPSLYKGCPLWLDKIAFSCIRGRGATFLVKHLNVSIALFSSFSTGWPVCHYRKIIDCKNHWPLAFAICGLLHFYSFAKPHFRIMIICFRKKYVMFLFQPSTALSCLNFKW